jgi:hypothetical protein
MQCRFHNSPPLDYILSQMNPIYTLAYGGFLRKFLRKPYCNVFVGYISRWNFITLKIQYTIVNYSPQRFQNSNTRTTSTSSLTQLQNCNQSRPEHNRCVLYLRVFQHNSRSVGISHIAVSIVKFPLHCCVTATNPLLRLLPLLYTGLLRYYGNVTTLYYRLLQQR